MSVKTKKAEKKSDKKAPAKKAPAVPESSRQKWNDVGMCALIRLCGSKQFGPQKTAKIIESMDLEANPATIKIQLRKGRNDDGVPALSKEAKSEFNAIAGDIENDKPKAKKAEKTEKKAKKADKTNGKKKMKKKTEDDDAEAQAEADADEEEVEEEIEEVEEEEDVDA